MSSASSTARCMDCTVDSMLTTTPFFRPREGCEPTPMISSSPSLLISPTMATTLLVPMSSPTKRFRSERFAMLLCASLSVCVVGAFGRRRNRAALIAPTDGKAIRVAHVHVSNFRHAVGDHLRGGANEAIQACIDIAPPETHGHAAVQIHLPGAPLAEAQRRNAHAYFGHAPLSCEVALGHFEFAAVRTAESRELRGYMGGGSHKQFAARVEQAGVAPARRGHLLHHRDMQAVRPAARDSRVIHPRQRFDRAL